jgi:hypothetical protein
MWLSHSTEYMLRSRPNAAPHADISETSFRNQEEQRAEDATCNQPAYTIKGLGCVKYDYKNSQYARAD